jgi:hypothetical protein
MTLILHTTTRAQTVEHEVTGGGGRGRVIIIKFSLAEVCQQMCPEDLKSTTLYGLPRIHTEGLVLLQDVGTYLPTYVVSYPRRWKSSNIR